MPADVVMVGKSVSDKTVPAQELTQIPESRARAFIDLMAAGQYAQAFESFTPQMKAAMPVDRLSAVWNGLTEQVGQFQRQISTSVMPRGVLSVVVVTCEFERATIEVNVTVNPANLVGGLAMRPADQTVSVTHCRRMRIPLRTRSQTSPSAAANGHCRRR